MAKKDKTSPNTKYIVDDNKVYQEVASEFFSTYKLMDVPKGKAAPTWTGAKLPFDMWQQMVGWCQLTQEKFASESLVYLFFDTAKNEWKHWFVPQITNGMTVASEPTNPNYNEQRKLFPDLQFGTLHHHCGGTAYASGVDTDDEQDREGLHFTVGKIGTDTHDLHYRFVLEGQVYVGDVADVVEHDPLLKTVPAALREKIHNLLLRAPVDLDEYDFTAALKNIKKVTPVAPKIGNYQQQHLPEDVLPMLPSGAFTLIYNQLRFQILQESATIIDEWAMIVDKDNMLTQDAILPQAVFALSSGAPKLKKGDLTATLLDILGFNSSPVVAREENFASHVAQQLLSMQNAHAAN